MTMANWTIYLKMTLSMHHPRWFFQTYYSLDLNLIPACTPDDASYSHSSCVYCCSLFLTLLSVHFFHCLNDRSEGSALTIEKHPSKWMCTCWKQLCGKAFNTSKNVQLLWVAFNFYLFQQRWSLWCSSSWFFEFRVMMIYLCSLRECLRRVDPGECWSKGIPEHHWLWLWPLLGVQILRWSLV
jgi:hypothetical protein